MNDFESELRARLAARAGAVSTTADWDDLVNRTARGTRRTTRALSLALALTVCAAAVTVTVAVRHDAHSPAPEKAASKPVSKPATDRVVATHAAVPTISAGANASDGGQNLSGYAIGGGTKISPLSQGQLTPLGIGGGAYFGGLPSTPMARVFTRTTAAGIVIRGYRVNISPQSEAQGPPWWTPPGWCFANGYVQADVSNDAIAGAGTAPLYAAQKNGAQVGGTVSVIGQNEQAPRWIVIAQGPDGATTLRASFPDGSSDEMAPVNGVAVLVGPGGADLSKAKVTLTALDAAGGTISTTTIAGNTPSNTFGPECSSPQTLPAPGANQPADATAARQAVIDTFDHAYAKGVTDDSTFAYFDDSHGFADIMAKLRAGTFKEQVQSAVLKFDDLVFLSPTVAAIQYEIDIPNYGIPSFAPRFNEAHLTDGTWKLARQGWCNDVSLAGVQQCPA